MKNARTHPRTKGSTARRAATPRRQSTAGHARARAGTTSRVARTLVDHDEIRRWAEERGGTPSAVKRTSRGKGDVGMIRLDFPGYSGEGKLEPIDWDDWFEKFDASNLALIVEDKTTGGEVSHFNKLVAREGPGRRARRAAEKGTPRKGTARASTPRKGTARASAARKGTARASATRKGTARASTARKGTARTPGKAQAQRTSTARTPRTSSRSRPR